MRHATSKLGALAVICAIATLPAAQTPLSTAWTYQAQLKDAGAPAVGDYDMRLALYDAPSGGSVLGVLRFDGIGTNPPPVTVVDGLFTLELDFGTGVFTGDALWLEIGVRPTGVGQYATLDPRQPLTAAPYALFALNGPGGGGNWDLNGADIHNNNSGNVGIGTTTPQRQLDIEASDATLRLTTTDTGPGATPRLQLKGSDGPGVFRPLGAVEFVDETDTLRAAILGNKSGAAAQISVTVNPGQLSQMRILDGSVRVKGQLEVTRPSDGTTSASIGAEGADSYLQLHGGSLGIGTAAPAAKLHVAGVAGVDGVMYPDGTLQTTAAGAGGGLWSANGNDIYYNNGDVGIGTSDSTFLRA